jgi:hypothetical protein
LTEELRLERARVMGLSSLAEPVSVLMTLSEEIRTSVSVLVKNQLLEDRGVCPEYNPHIFSDMTQSKKYDEITDADAGFSGETNPNAAANKYVLKKWLFDKAAESSLRVEPVSLAALDDFLPEQPVDPPVIGGAYDLTDARLLIRAVVCLCYDVFEDNTGSQHETGAKPSLPMTVLEEIKNLRKKGPLSMMRVVTRLAHDYLSTPLFKANDLSRGDPNVMNTFLAYLMLTEAPVRPQSTNLDISKFLGEYQQLQRGVELARTRNETIVEQLFRVQNSWAEATEHTVIQKSSTESSVMSSAGPALTKQKTMNSQSPAPERPPSASAASDASAVSTVSSEGFRKSAKLLFKKVFDEKGEEEENDEDSTAGASRPSTSATAESSSNIADSDAVDHSDAGDDDDDDKHSEDNNSSLGKDKKDGVGKSGRTGKSGKVKFAGGGEGGSSQRSSKKHSGKADGSKKKNSARGSKKKPEGGAVESESEAENEPTDAPSEDVPREDQPASDAATSKPIDKPSQAELYAKLSGEVDGFLSAYAKLDIAEYENGLLGTVQEMGRDLLRVLALRSKVVGWHAKRQKGMRLASDAHRAAASYVLESLSQRSDWVISDMDDKYDHRAAAGHHKENNNNRAGGRDFGVAALAAAANANSGTPTPPTEAVAVTTATATVTNVDSAGASSD